MGGSPYNVSIDLAARCAWVGHVGGQPAQRIEYPLPSAELADALDQIRGDGWLLLDGLVSKGNASTLHGVVVERGWRSVR